jgi:PilZ domain
MIDIWKVKRTEPRIALKLPVILEGLDASSVPFRDETVTENVSKNGACVIVNHTLAVGATVSVIASQGKFSGQAIIKGIWLDDCDRKTKIGIQFVGPVQNWVIS